MSYVTLGSAFTSQQRAVIAVQADVNGVVSENPIDLTSRVLVGQISDSGDCSDDPSDTASVLASLTEGSGITVVDAVQGIFTWSLTATQGREIRAASDAPARVRRQLALRVWDAASASEPVMLYEEIFWGF